MKTAYLFSSKRALNDATSYYVRIIKEALESKGVKCFEAHRLSELNSADIIITITGKYFLLSKLRYPFKKTIFWAQGIAAEEAKMGNYGKLSFLGRYLCEKAAVKRSNVLFVVSKRMLEFYREKYGYQGDNYVVMPCFNKQIVSSFDLLQYREPTFVYAGSFSVWQGVDLMLDVYKLVEEKLPGAKLTILSNQKEQFEKKLINNGIKNYSIKYVSLEELGQELHKYKYGFILREDHIVNNVSTPTKMNSYLSVYIIPLFSDAVNDFADNIKLGPFTLMFKCPLDAHVIASRIVEFEKSEIDYSKYKEYVEKVFDEHYNEVIYKGIILEKINKVL